MLNPNKISQETINRYSKRYESMGRNIRTLGWGSVEQQYYRFQQTLCATNFHNKSLLDIGCGFADYYEFIRSENISLNSYMGWDINPNFIKESQARFGSLAKFRQVDILDQEELKDLEVSFDIVVMLGLLNFNLKDKRDNYSYSNQVIHNAFRLTEEVLIVDFLSNHRDPNYPSEDFVFYHSPSKMLDVALSLTSNVTLKHDYSSIPQKEFMLFIYK